MNFRPPRLYLFPVPAVRLFAFVALSLSLLWALAAGPWARAEISADEKRKRELFLRAREEIEPAPAATPTPAPVRPQPRPRPGSAGEKKPSSTPKPVQKPTPALEEEEEEAPALPAKKPSEAKPAPQDEPDVIKLPPPREIKLPPPRPVATPAATPAAEPGEIKLPPPRPLVTPPPSAAKTPADVPAAPIVIEKSGLEEDQGLAPAPPPAKRGFLWFGGPSYRYLTRSVRAAIDRAPVKRGRWQYIVVHNSGTKQGNARIFANYHRNVRKMKNGLAYHFVIGNGTSSGNGEIEIGSRWTNQINGGHVASDYLNNIAIGICFVGDFNRSQPTPAQLAALEELIRYLRERVGKSKGRASIVKAHREINPKPTDCPGDRFPYRWLHRRFN